MSGLFHTGATELHDIFLAPLQAVIDAEISLADSVQEFIRNTGFDEDGNLITVDFHYVLHGEKETISVPVLSMITLPLLGIKDAEFDMHVKMMSLLEEHEEPVHIAPALVEGESSPLPKKVALKGYMTPTNHPSNLTESTTMKSNMKVKLHMAETSMPGGIIKLLALMNNNLIHNKNKENDQSE